MFRQMAVWQNQHSHSEENMYFQ